MKQRVRGAQYVRHVSVALLCIFVMLVAGCGQQPAGTSTSAPSGSQQVAAASAVPSASQQVTAAPSASATAAPSAAVVTAVPSATPAASPTTGPTTTPTLAAGQFRNPVIDQDFPDPDTLKAGDTYYAYATNAAGKNIQEAKSNDLVHWEMLSDALPQLPSWANAAISGLTWAPEVTAYGNTYVMYFVSRDTASDKQCIGVGTSDKPEGPFKDANDKPLICQADQGGSIDPASFKDDDGTRYVLWKNDGNCCGLDTWLYIQKVSADGLTLEGQPTQLIKEDQAWEGNLVEAPTLWKHNNKYYLLYSANNYAGADYATGYAVADAITGPYTKPQNKPLMATDFKNGAAIGPGGQDVVVDDDGETWIMYHSWDPTNAYRRVQIDKLEWNGDTPKVDGPSKDPEPLP